MKRYIKSAIYDVTNESLDVQGELARDPNTPAEILLKLTPKMSPYRPNTLESYSYELEMWIAHNPNATAEILSTLSNSKAWYVRAAVADNSNTPDDVLKKLTDDDDELVRRKANDTLHFKKYGGEQ